MQQIDALFRYCSGTAIRSSTGLHTKAYAPSQTNVLINKMQRHRPLLRLPLKRP